jgi:hypothetical protein
MLTQVLSWVGGTVLVVLAASFALYLYDRPNQSFIDWLFQKL